jgi:hypothetical protein
MKLLLDSAKRPVAEQFLVQPEFELISRQRKAFLPGAGWQNLSMNLIIIHRGKNWMPRPGIR